jgi:hypothetical protein
MGDFVGAALGFPAVLFSFLLLVVIGYWIVVVLGGLGVDALDADAPGLDGADAAGAETAAGDVGGHTGVSGVLGAAGLGGVPVTVVLSLLIALAWFASLVGGVLRHGAGGPGLALGILAAALVLAWLATRLLVLPLRRVFRAEPGPSRGAFVGRMCVIRTGRVGTDFGQAEVHAPDGSSAIIQVRQTGRDQLRAGSTALIYDYDPEGEFFLVVPDPDLSTPGQKDI